MGARAVMFALLTAAGCAQPASDACGNGRFCPADTTCGVHDVCFAHIGTCGQFDDRMPCLVDELTSGFCLAGTCRPGLEATGFAISIPSRTPLPGVDVIVRGHPEILPLVTNANGYFDVRAPHDIEAVIELSDPDAFVSITRPVVIGGDDVLVDFLYGGIPIIPEALATLLAVQVGTQIQPGRGFIAASSVEPVNIKEIGGVTFELAQGSCEGPYYFDSSGMPVIGAQATFDLNGSMAFANCEPGAAVVVANASGAPCRPLDVATTGPIPVTVEPDRVLYLGRVTCGP